MRDADRKQVIAEIVELAGTLGEVEATVARLAEWSGRGYPAGGDGTGRGQGGSPTELAVERCDGFLLDRVDLDASLRMARDALRRVRRVCTVSRPVGQMTDEVWCRSHRRVGAKEPIHELSRKSGLCRFCYDVQRTYGRLPTVAILDARGRGRRITVQMIERELGVKESA